MYYTIGHSKIYDNRLNSKNGLYKMGKGVLDTGEEYPGGIVFHDITDAKNSVMENGKGFAVYTLDCDEDNIYFNDYEGSFHIIDKCRVVDKVSSYDEITGEPLC